MYRRILDASVRILAEEGALGFTTTKVADEAGISVGSLYQYFPNKQALIVALHDDDIEQGWDTANEILDHPTWTASHKLTELIRWFFESEAHEARTLGAASGDIHVFLRDQGARTRQADLVVAATRRAADFIASCSTTARTQRQLDHSADFLVSTVETLAKAIATRDLSPTQRRQWADDTSSMLAAHLGIPD